MNITIEIIDETDKEGNEIVYEPPEMIVYGSVEELTKGGSGNTDDTNPNHPHYHNS